MLEIKTFTLDDELKRKLKSISEKSKKLNIGGDTVELWIGQSQGGGGYDWSQTDMGVDNQGNFIMCEQSGCSCNSPEQPTPDVKKPLSGDIVIENNDYNETASAVEELRAVTETLYKVFNDKPVSPKQIIELPNAEIRRAVVEYVGYDKIVETAQVLDEDIVNGRLLKIPLENDEDIVVVHVIDPSTDREYFLRVPPNMKTAKQARAWTFGFKAEDFDLAVES